MSRTIFLYTLLFILLVTGCSSLALPTPATREPLKTAMPPLESNWTIKMTHSGGIMGLMRSIEIASDGKYKVVDERKNKEVTKQLSSNELSKLQQIVLNTEFNTTEMPSVCADCFIYNLEIQWVGKKFSAQVDDISISDSGMEPLIRYLRDLIDAALK